MNKEFRCSYCNSENVKVEVNHGYETKKVQCNVFARTKKEANTEIEANVKYTAYIIKCSDCNKIDTDKVYFFSSGEDGT